MGIEEAYDRVFRYCYYRVRDRAVAEDLTQETFLRFLNSGYRERGRMMNYLYTVARNLCVEEARRRRPLPMPEALSDGGAMSEEALTRLHVEAALAALSEDDRELVVLRYINGEPMAEICRLKGLSRFALYRRLRSATRQLKTLLGGADDA